MSEAKTPDELQLPVRASIYLAPDGAVHFGALFEDLVPVARALGANLDLEPRPASDAGQDAEPEPRGTGGR
jgi:hypothetical protein